MNNRLKCKYHPNGKLLEDYSSGDIVCLVCGLVVGDRFIDPGSEWRSFANDDSGVDNCRVGEAETDFTGATATSITIRQGTDARHFDENGKNKYTSYGTQSSSERAMNSCKNDLKLICNNLHVDSSTSHKALSIFNQLLKSENCPKRKNKALVCACLYSACNQLGLSRSLDEISSVSGCTKKDIAVMFKRLGHALDIKFENSDPAQYVARFISKMNIKDKKVEKIAREVAQKVREKGLLQKNHASAIAASVILFVCQTRNVPMTVGNVVEVSGSSQSSIRQIFKYLKNNSTTLINTN